MLLEIWSRGQHRAAPFDPADPATHGQPLTLFTNAPAPAGAGTRFGLSRFFEIDDGDWRYFRRLHLAAPCFAGRHCQSFRLEPGAAGVLAPLLAPYAEAADAG